MKFVQRPLLRWSPQRWFGASFDYEPQLVQDFRGMPVKAWDDQSKTWWFPDTVAPIVRQLMIGYFPGQHVPELPRIGGAEGARAMMNEGRGRTPYDTLGVLQGAPDCVVDAAYKALVKDLDPEHNGVGGSYEPVETVKAAYRQIMIWRGR